MQNRGIPSRFCSLKVTTRKNCRDLTSGEPYIHQLAEDGSDIIVIVEHWLWPYEAKWFGEIYPTFATECTADSRLPEKSDLAISCGGVGVIFQKLLNVSPISQVIAYVAYGFTSPHLNHCASQCLGCISLVLIRVWMHTVVSYSS